MKENIRNREDWLREARAAGLVNGPHLLVDGSGEQFVDERGTAALWHYFPPRGVVLRDCTHRCVHGIERIDCDLCDCEKYLAIANARIAQLEAALREVRHRLDPYMKLPTDRWPGPCGNIVEYINYCLAAETDSKPDGVPCPHCGAQFRDHDWEGGSSEFFFRIQCPQNRKVQP